MKTVFAIFDFVVSTIFIGWALMITFKDEPTIKDIAPMIAVLVVISIVNEWKLSEISKKLKAE